MATYIILSIGTLMVSRGISKQAYMNATVF